MKLEIDSCLVIGASSGKAVGPSWVKQISNCRHSQIYKVIEGVVLLILKLVNEPRDYVGPSETPFPT